MSLAALAEWELQPYTPPITRTIQFTSAILFYLLAGSTFLAVIVLRNEVLAPLPSWWLSIIDLPLLVSGMLYGGASVYLSFGREKSVPLALTIILPLLALFLAAFIFNFWPLLS